MSGQSAGNEPAALLPASLMVLPILVPALVRIIIVALIRKKESEGLESEEEFKASDLDHKNV